MLVAAALFLSNNAVAQHDDLHDFHPDQFVKDVSVITSNNLGGQMPAPPQPQTAVFRDNTCNCVLGVGETKAFSEGATILQSKNNQYSLVFTKNGMQLWKGANGAKTKSLWSVTFNSFSTGNLEVKSEGTFGFSDGTGNKWIKTTNGSSGMGNVPSNSHYVRLQDDGNLVLYNNKTALWATGTNNQ